YEYILVTDHGPSLQIANGIDKEEIKEQKKEIENLNNELDVRILHGIEANITKNGELDISQEKSKEFDIVVVALHDRLENPTEKIISVFENYPVDILAHPTNRMINEREPMDLDMDKIMEKASEKRIAIEINSQPSRLDLDWRDVKEYRDRVRYVISTDAHSTSEMDYMHLGVSQARRGWCEKNNILNTRRAGKLLEYFSAGEQR
ncbi:MAG: hypothetical protein ABEJ72_08990, partial [Candidatus Aenigmatarchaeota archaeon]